GKLPAGDPPQQIHLPQAVLGPDVALGFRQVFDRSGAAVRHAPIITLHSDAGLQAGERRGAIQLGKRAINEPPDGGGEGEDHNGEEPKEKTEDDAQVEFHLKAEEISVVEATHPRNLAKRRITCWGTPGRDGGGWFAGKTVVEATSYEASPPGRIGAATMRLGSKQENVPGAADWRVRAGGVERLFRRGGVFAGDRAGVAGAATGGSGQCAGAHRREVVERLAPSGFRRASWNHP